MKERIHVILMNVFSTLPSLRFFAFSSGPFSQIKNLCALQFPAAKSND